MEEKDKNEIDDLIDIENLKDNLSNIGYLPELQSSFYRGNLCENGCIEVSQAFDEVANVVIDAFEEINKNLKSKLNEIINKVDELKK